MHQDNQTKELFVNHNKDIIVHGEMEMQHHCAEILNVKMLILPKVNLTAIQKYLDVAFTLILVLLLKTIVIIIML